MRFKDNELNNLSFYVQPEATFYPPHEITSDNTRLEGFMWRIKERPSLFDVLNPPVDRIKAQSDSTKSEVKGKPTRVLGKNAPPDQANLPAIGAAKPTVTNAPLVGKPNLNEKAGVRKKSGSNE